MKRRRFLQVLAAFGAAPLLPALPAMPASAATSGTVSASAASKALWAGLHANAASSSKFVSIARTMGLSNTAIQGVAARTVGVRLPISALARKIAARTTPNTQRTDLMGLREKMKQLIAESLNEDDDAASRGLNRQANEDDVE